MLKARFSLVVFAHMVAAVAVSAQTSYIFQLPGSAPINVVPRIIGSGDNNLNRVVTSASTAALAGAFKVIATPNGAKFYILTSNGVLSANATLGALTPLSALAGAVTDAQVTPDGRYLFVLTSQLYIIDTATDALAASANTGLPGAGATPVAVAFSHDSRTAWILSNTNGASTITIVNLGATPQTPTTPRLNIPGATTSMVLSPNNLLYLTSDAGIIYEIDPVSLALTSTGQISVPGTGVPGRLQFTPDGTNAYFLNHTICSSCSPVFKLNVQSHSITSWLPTLGDPPEVDQLLVAGNSRVFGWSSADTQLWDVAPTSVAVTPAVFGGGFLTTNHVLAAAVSDENPSSRFLYLVYPDLSFVRITLANNDAAEQGQLNLSLGKTLQFVSIPAQSNTAIQPLRLSLINPTRSVATGASTLLTGQLLDSVGRPVLGAPFVFAADTFAGIGITPPSAATTTAGGWAETTVTAPVAPGTYTVTLCTPSCNSNAVTGNFTLNVANAVSGGSGQMSIYAGDGQLLRENQSTAQTATFVPLTVKITDVNGNPLAGVPVTFQIKDGGIGGLDQIQSTTNQAGLATTNYSSDRIPTNQHVFQSTVHANSIYGDLDFIELTYATANHFPSPLTLPLPISRTVSVPQGSIVPAGVTSQTFTGDNVPISNVGLRFTDDLSNPTPNSTVASCAGSSRSDSNGLSTCNVMAFCQPNTSLPHDFPVILEVGELLAFRYTIHVTQGVASVLQAQPGSSLSLTGNPGTPILLKARVTDGCGQPIATTGLNWSILPGSVAAQIVNSFTAADSAGNVSATVTLGQTAGLVQVQLSGSGMTPIIFRITDQITITSIAPVSPLPSSVTVGQQFQPLSFLVSNQSSPVAGVTVSFSVAGNATLNTLSTTSNAQGLAQVTVTAGSTAGTIVVTATANGLSNTATLVSHGAGPTITANSFTNAASGALGMTPCGLITVTGTGVAPEVQGTVAPVSFFGAYLYTVAGLTITVNGNLAPIQSVSNDQLGQHATFQAPCELTGSAATVVVNVNGASTTITNVPLLPFQPGIFTSVGSNSKLYGAVIREADGTYVTAINPARPGEKVYVVVTGLGQTTPGLFTNSAGTGAQNVIVPTAVFLGPDDAHLTGVNATSARYLFGSIGSYLVEFQIPANAPTGIDQKLLVVALINNGNDFLLSNTVLMPNVGFPPQ